MYPLCAATYTRKPQRLGPVAYRGLVPCIRYSVLCTRLNYSAPAQKSSEVLGNSAGRNSARQERRRRHPWRFGPKAFTKYYNVRDPQEIQKEADAEVPLQKVYGDWPVSTDPNVHIKAINELFESGATIVNIHCAQPDQKKVVDFYGREVIPHVKRS